MYGILDGSGNLLARFVIPMQVRTNRPKFTSDTLSLKRHSRVRSAQRWEISTKLEPLLLEANELQAQLISSDTDVAFEILMPQNVGAKMKRTYTGNVTATGNAGTNILSISAGSGLLPTGTFIRFSNHSKVYMVEGNTDMSSGQMKIYPSLRTNVSGATFTYGDNVRMLVVYDADTVVGMSYNEDAILMDVGVVKLIEKL